jgi:hypothetical protein
MPDELLKKGKDTIRGVPGSMPLVQGQSGRKLEGLTANSPRDMRDVAWSQVKGGEELPTDPRTVYGRQHQDWVGRDISAAMPYSEGVKQAVSAPQAARDMGTTRNIMGDANGEGSFGDRVRAAQARMAGTGEVKGVARPMQSMRRSFPAPEPQSPPGVKPPVAEAGEADAPGFTGAPPAAFSNDPSMREVRAPAGSPYAGALPDTSGRPMMPSLSNTVAQAQAPAGVAPPQAVAAPPPAQPPMTPEQMQMLAAVRRGMGQQ